MKKSYKNKLLVFFSIGIILTLSGCVDTGVENISEQNYRSLVRFANNVPGVDASITVDNSSVGTVPSGGQSDYADVPSGSRNIAANFTSGSNVNQVLTLETEFRITITIVEDTTGARSFVKTLDGPK